MYNNSYANIYNPQMSIDRINAQMAELEQMKQRLQQPVQQPTPTNLTQNFQLAPTSRDVIRYANSMDDVQKEMIVGETPFFSKDMSIVWVKNINNEIKTYELTEIISKDEKDIQIEMLKERINRLENERNNVNEWNNEYDDKPVKDEKSSSVSTVRGAKKK